MNARFVGDPKYRDEETGLTQVNEHGKPVDDTYQIKVGRTVFKLGEWSDTSDLSLADQKKVAGNSHFEVDGEPDEAPAVAEKKSRKK